MTISVEAASQHRTGTLKLKPFLLKLFKIRFFLFFISFRMVPPLPYTYFSSPRAFFESALLVPVYLKNITRLKRDETQTQARPPKWSTQAVGKAGINIF